MAATAMPCAGFCAAIRAWRARSPPAWPAAATCIRPAIAHPLSSINYITCHDGFTLNDLVSYRDKHNEANAEDNRDGWGNNNSWNRGTEGDTLDENVVRQRRQDIRNAFALLLLSQGVPMLLAGDEVLRTQRGNNNAWCQDNELSWFDWRLTETNSDMLRFVREMIALRRRHPGLSRACAS
jgi:isoamylase